VAEVEVSGAILVGSYEKNDLGSGNEEISHPATIPGNDCQNCGTLLDPDGSCFVCKTTPRKEIYA